MAIYDYVCRDGHTTEARRGYDVTSIPCPLCGDVAFRLAVNHISFEMREGETEVKDSKGNYRLSRVTEAASEIDHEYKKVEKKEGRPVQSPSLYQAGIQRARLRGARIRT